MKPVIVVHIPKNLEYIRTSFNPNPELYRLWEMFDTYIKAETKGDYYVLTFFNDDNDMEFKVEVFNTPNIPDIEIESLRAQLLNQIKRYKPTDNGSKDNIIRSES